MIGSELKKVIFLVLVCSAVAFALSFSRQGREERFVLPDQKTLLEIIVLAEMARTETGIDVREGQEIVFEASGQISLQRGNPMADCGPEGYPLQTMQQPFTDKNIGALIGEVVWPISVEIDEKSGEELRHEISEKFYIGAENKVRMPLSGHLFLRVNENLVGDNYGEFRVKLNLGWSEERY